MKYLNYLLIAMMLFFTVSCEKDVLTEEQVIEGLKEALKVGTNNSVESANATNGYYGNSAIKIPFPDEVDYVATALSNIGMQNLVDDLILKLNRAAEDAADEAAPIFIDAILNITFADAMNILDGADDAATQYLKDNTYTSLKTAFEPDIDNSLSSVGASQAWETLATAYNSIPLTNDVNTDLADYTTGKALDGLFYLVAQEEGKIRNDPAARVTEVLEQVFGSGE